MELLVDRMRRYILYYLECESDGSAALEDLVEYVARELPDAGTRQRVRVACRHTHLPKLAAAGVIEVDERTDTVRYYDGLALAEQLELVATHERR